MFVEARDRCLPQSLHTFKHFHFSICLGILPTCMSALFAYLVPARTRRMSQIVLSYCMDAGNLNLGPLDDGSALSGWAVSSASHLFFETASPWSSFG